MGSVIAKKSVDRLTFALGISVALACIWLLPIFFNAFVYSTLGGSAEMSAIRMLFRALGLPLGLLCIMIPLSMLTRRRLRDLSLSGVLLLAFPVWPLLVIAAGPFLAFTMYPLGGGRSLFTTPDFYLGALCLLLLMLVPGSAAGGTPPHSKFIKLQSLTDCEGRIGRGLFAKNAGLLLLATFGISMFPLLFMFGLGRSVAMAWVMMAVVTGLGVVKLFIELVFISLSVRRLNDLGRSYWWAALMPLFFLPLCNFLAASLPFMLRSGSLGGLFSTSWGGMGWVKGILLLASIASIALFGWLLTAETTAPGLPPAKTDDTLQPALQVAPAAISSRTGKILLAGAAIALAAVVMLKVEHPYDTMRYRMTVEVETPEGIKTGSSVRELAYVNGPHGYPSFKGEAIAIDLGQRGLLFAALKSIFASPTEGDYNIYAYTDNFKEREKTPPGTKVTLQQKKYPQFVHFRDINDPATAENVFQHGGSVDRMEEIYGTGVRLKEVTVEATNDPVTTGIEKYLPWLPARSMMRGYFTGDVTIPDEQTKTFLTFDDFMTRVPVDKDAALKCLRDKANGGDAQAMLWLGDLYNDSIRYGRELPVKYDPDEARKWYTTAAEKDYVPAIKSLGRSYMGSWRGGDKGRDTEQALLWYRKAVKLGDPEAAAMIANLYFNGGPDGVQKDYARALFWRLVAAKSGREFNFARMDRFDGPKPSTCTSHLTEEQIAVIRKRAQEWDAATGAADALDDMERKPSPLAPAPASSSPLPDDTCAQYKAVNAAFYEECEKTTNAKHE